MPNFIEINGFVVKAKQTDRVTFEFISKGLNTITNQISNKIVMFGNRLHVVYNQNS